MADRVGGQAERWLARIDHVLQREQP
jgi:hypothetical protein